VFCTLRDVDHKCFSEFPRIVIPLSLASKIQVLRFLEKSVTSQQSVTSQKT